MLCRDQIVEHASCGFFSAPTPLVDVRGSSALREIDAGQTPLFFSSRFLLNRIIGVQYLTQLKKVTVGIQAVDLYIGDRCPVSLEVLEFTQWA